MGPGGFPTVKTWGSDKAKHSNNLEKVHAKVQNLGAATADIYTPGTNSKSPWKFIRYLLSQRTMK